MVWITDAGSGAAWTAPASLEIRAGASGQLIGRGTPRGVAAGDRRRRADHTERRPRLNRDACVADIVAEGLPSRTFARWGGGATPRRVHCPCFSWASLALRPGALTAP